MTGVASGPGWNRTLSVPRVDGHSVATSAKVRRAGQKVKVHRGRRSGGGEVKGGMLETGSFTSTVPPLLAGYQPSLWSYTKRTH